MGAALRTRAATSSREGARAASAFLRARRFRRLRPTFAGLYFAVLAFALATLLGGHALSAAIGSGLGVRALGFWVPVGMMLVLLAALRFGAWQGPVAFSAADVALLLSAPIAHAELVRDKLDRTFIIALLAGLAVGVVMALISSGGPTGSHLLRSVCGVVAFGSLGGLTAAASWLVQSSRRAAELVHRATPAITLGALSIILIARAGDVGQTVATWSGPWGWTIAPLTATPGWPVLAGLMPILATSMVMIARRRAGAATLESFLARAETRAGITTAATLLDYRGASLTYRAALGSGARRLRRSPRPTSRRLVVLWRDELALLRHPSRGAWAALLSAAGTWEALTHPGRPVAAGIAAAALYFAASCLCEPLRADVDHPDKSRLLLSWDFPRVLVAHCALPCIVLLSVAATTTLAAIITGAASLGALALIPTVLPPCIGVAVLSAALAARRGGRIGGSALNGILVSAATDPIPGATAILWLAPWLVLEVATVGGSLLLLGHSTNHHHPIVSAGILALGLTSAALTAILIYARRCSAPD